MSENVLVPVVPSIVNVSISMDKMNATLAPLLSNLSESLKQVEQSGLFNITTNENPGGEIDIRLVPKMEKIGELISFKIVS